MGIGELLGLSIETLLISLCLKIMSILITVILYGRMIEIYCTVSIAPIPHCNDEQPRMGQHRHELPQRAVRAGIPRLPHHGVRCDLCRAHQQHDHRSQYPLGAILGGSLYGHSLLLPVQDRFACKVTIQCPLRKEGQLEEILRDLRRPSVAVQGLLKEGAWPLSGKPLPDP